MEQLGVPFGYHVRELACHHMMAYHDRLAAAADGDPRAEEALRAHCRRAVLELVLRRKGYAYPYATIARTPRTSRLGARPQHTRRGAPLQSDRSLLTCLSLAFDRSGGCIGVIKNGASLSF